MGESQKIREISDTFDVEILAIETDKDHYFIQSNTKTRHSRRVKITKNK